jgi:hypothetical protein
MKSDTTTKRKKIFNKKPIFISTLFIISLVVAVGAAWYLQQKKIDALATDKSSVAATNIKNVKALQSAQKTTAKLQQEVDNLNTTINEMKNPNMADLALTINEVKHNGVIYNETGNDMLFIDVTVTNKSKKLDGYFAASDLKLKDTKNNIYPLCQNSPVGYYVCQSGLNTPAGKTELVSQSVPVGSTVRGTIGFYVPKDFGTCTLTYKNSIFQLHAQSAQGM